MIFKYDFLIIGAGVAGMSYALKVARAKKGRVCLICKTTLDEAILLSHKVAWLQLPISRLTISISISKTP